MTDALFLAPALDEFVEVGGGTAGAEGRKITAEEVDAGAGGVGAGFKQVEELVVFAEELFEREHALPE